MRKFNVHIKNSHFHELHHALGCPWPDEIMGETYRNYFATDGESCTADRMRASPHWSNGTERLGMVYFFVSKEGKRALLEHIKDHVSVPARYVVTYRDGWGESVVTAKSRSAAKYAAYIDADFDCTFMEFCGGIASVRLMHRNHSPNHADSV